MAESVTTTTTKGNTTVSTTVSKDKPGKAWIANKGKDKAKNPWVKPKEPKVKGEEFAWDDNDGWIAKSTSASTLASNNEYSMPLAIIDSDESLAALFNEAWLDQKQGREWSKDKFQTRLKSTKWYTERSASQRLYYVLKNDPQQEKEFISQLNKKESNVQALANANGITLTPAEAKELADKSLQLGYTDTQLTAVMASYINYNTTGTAAAISNMSGSLTGNAGKAEDDIRDWAKRNMVTLSDSEVLGYVRQAAVSGWDISKATDAVTNMAKQDFSHWADKLDGITSLDSLASNFKNVISDEFGDDIKSITFDNKFLKQAMRAKDDKGMPIDTDTLRKTLYKTDEWSNVTKNKNKIMGAGRDILTRMGF